MIWERARLVMQEETQQAQEAHRANEMATIKRKVAALAESAAARRIQALFHGFQVRAQNKDRFAALVEARLNRGIASTKDRGGRLESQVPPAKARGRLIFSVYIYIYWYINGSRGLGP